MPIKKSKTKAPNGITKSTDKMSVLTQNPIRIFLFFNGTMKYLERRYMGIKLNTILNMATGTRSRLMKKIVIAKLIKDPRRNAKDAYTIDLLTSIPC